MPGRADISCQQQCDAAGAHIGGADGVLGLTHAPDESRRLLGGEHLRNALELFAGNPADSLDLFRRPLLDLLPGILKAVYTLLDEFLVFPAVLNDVPHHAVKHRNVCAGTQPNVFSRVRRGPRQSRIDNDEICVVQFGAFQQMLQVIPGVLRRDCRPKSK